MTATTVHIPTIVTDRLRLRAHTRADFEPLAALWATPRARYMGGPLSRRDAWFTFSSDCLGWMLDGHGCWAVDLSDGTFIGQVGLNRPDHFPEPEFGWLLLDGFDGQGYALEAARAGLDHVFATLGLASVVSYIDIENTPSIALATRLGAIPDPGAALPDGDTPDDTLVYRHHPDRGTGQ